MEMIQETKVVSVTDLSKKFHVSDVTIRRDLMELEKTTEKVRRTHGGAIWSDFAVKGMNYEPLYPELENANQDIKDQIAVSASRLINDYSAIMIDSSSTAKQLCSFILKNPPQGLTVVTNSVRVAMLFSDSPTIEVIIIGGQMRKGIVSCIGHLAESAIKQIRVDKAFLGINGVDFAENTLTMPSLTEGAVKSEMISSSKETIILADHTKFGKTYLYKVCNATEVDLIITDKGVSAATVSQAEKCNANLLIAK